MTSASVPSPAAGGDPAAVLDQVPLGTQLRAALSLPQGRRVLAAVSGGPDSSALLAWLVEAGHDVVAAHFDHALRGGSERDVEHVAALCAGLDVQLFTERRARPIPKGSLQAAARELRYEFLERARRQAGAQLVALGHTADDRVEGALLHLLRGSGLAGLRGMPARRGRVVRPFLAVWRSEIEDFLAQRDVVALRDPANTDIHRFARAHVRHVLLPALERARPGITARIRAAAATAAEVQARLEAEAALFTQEAEVAATAERHLVALAPRATRCEVYRRLYGRAPALTRRHLEAIDRLVTSGLTGDGLDLPGGTRFRLEPKRLVMRRGGEEAVSPPRLRVRPCSGCEEAGAVHLRAAQLTLGWRQPGLRLRTAAGTRKLQDVLTDAKVPRHIRDSIPLVFASGRLAWVPGVTVAADCRAAPGEPGLHVNLEGGPPVRW